MARRLLLLNGLAALGAVLYHATGWGYTSLFWWTDRYRPVVVPNFDQMGGASYYALRALEQLATASVPAFLFVSGFFMVFASGRSQRIEWPMVAGRLKMLVPPFVVWSVLILAGRALEGRVFTADVYLEQIVFGQVAPPFYYVPALIQLYLLSPFFVWALKRRAGLLLIGAAVVQGAVMVARYPVLLGWDAPWATWIWNHAPAWFFPHLVFWFVLGAYAGFKGAAFTSALQRWRPALPWIAAALFLAAIAEWELLLRASHREWLAATSTLLDGVFSGALVLAFLAVLHDHVPARRQFEVVGERSFGLYLVHAPVLELCARAIYHGSPAVLGHQAIFLTLLLLVGAGVPLVLMAAVNRSRVRPVYNYLFG